MTKHKQITNISIDDEDLDVEFYARVNKNAQTPDTNEIDWSAGAIFTKTLSANTTLTFVGLAHAQNKVITLLITGAHALSFPSNVKTISGTYNGKVMNYIQIHCVHVDSINIGNNEYWMTINQEAV